MNASQAFYKAYKGSRNFLTPNRVCDLIDTGCYFVELSWGTGIFNDKLYGVTVVSRFGEPQYKLSACFPTEDDARTYITEELTTTGKLAWNNI